MNVLLVGTGGFINGTDPKIPAAAAHTWLCDGGHKTLFSGRRRCGRRRRSHGSAALRAAGPPYMVRAGDPPSSLSRCRRLSIRRGALAAGPWPRPRARGAARNCPKSEILVDHRAGFFLLGLFLSTARLSIHRVHTYISILIFYRIGNNNIIQDVFYIMYTYITYVIIIIGTVIVVNVHRITKYQSCIGNHR